MNAGKLNRRIVIQSPSTTVDEYNEPIGGWVDVASVWADIKHKSGLETLKSSADVSIVNSSIRIRYRTDITAGMRAVYGATIYDIQAVLPDASGKVYTDIVAQTGASQG